MLQPISLLILLMVALHQGQGASIRREDKEDMDVEIVYPERIHPRREKRDLSTEIKDKNHEDTLLVKIPTKQHGELQFDLKKRKDAPGRILVRIYAEDGTPNHEWHDPSNCFYDGTVIGKRDSSVRISTCDAMLYGYVDFDDKKYDIEPQDGPEGAHRFFPTAVIHLKDEGEDHSTEKDTASEKTMEINVLDEELEKKPDLKSALEDIPQSPDDDEDDEDDEVEIVDEEDENEYEEDIRSVEAGGPMQQDQSFGSLLEDDGEQIFEDIDSFMDEDQQNDAEARRKRRKKGKNKKTKKKKKRAKKNKKGKKEETDKKKPTSINNGQREEEIEKKKTTSNNNEQQEEIVYSVYILSKNRKCYSYPKTVCAKIALKRGYTMNEVSVSDKPSGCVMTSKKLEWNDNDQSAAACSKLHICICQKLTITDIQSSSVHDSSHGPQQALSSSTAPGFFQSADESKPWLMVQFRNRFPSVSSTFKSINVIIAKCCSKDFINVEVRAGAAKGLKNDVVAIFRGPGGPGEYTIQFNKEVVNPKYLSFQLQGSGVLAFKGIRSRNKMPASEVRCQGQGSGCCTAQTPCGVGQGQCRSDDQCDGTLTCGRDNCHWGHEQRCCQDDPYKRLGCWKEGSPQAFPSLEGDSRLDGPYKRRADALGKCLAVAKAKGLMYFALRDGGECAGGERSGEQYRIYGRSKDCGKDRKGGPGLNTVYVINGRWLLSNGATLLAGTQLTSANGKYSCKQFYSGLLELQGPGGKPLWKSKEPERGIQVLDGLVLKKRYGDSIRGLELEKRYGHRIHATIYKYDPGQLDTDSKSAIWDSWDLNLGWASLSFLLLTDDGDLVMFGDASVVGIDLWSSKHGVTKSKYIYVSGTGITQLGEEFHNAESSVPEHVSSVYKPYLSANVLHHTRYVEMLVSIGFDLFYSKFDGDRNKAIWGVLNTIHETDRAYAKVNIRVVLVAIEIQNHGDAYRRGVYPNAMKNYGLHAEKLQSEEPFKHINIDNSALFSNTGWGEAVGRGWPMMMCDPEQSSSMNKWYHRTVNILNHELGHNLGFSHNSDRPKKCLCIREGGGKGRCMMDQTPGDGAFDTCSLSQLNRRFAIKGSFSCLDNLPNNIAPKCGNGIMEEGESCDCGTPERCAEIDPCCEPHGCRLKQGAKCSLLNTPDCCTRQCTFKPTTTVCREAVDNCDVPDYCPGNSGQCTIDKKVDDGVPCAEAPTILIGIEHDADYDNPDESFKRERTAQLTPPISGRFVKIIPKQWKKPEQSSSGFIYGKGYACMQGVEMYGCALGKSSTGASCKDAFKLKDLPNEAFDASTARAYRGKVDGDGIYGWCSLDVNNGGWWQVDLGSRKDVSAIRIGSQENEWITSYNVQYSDDGKTWKDYQHRGIRDNSFCYKGACALTRDHQCSLLWDAEAKSAPQKCWDDLNGKESGGYGTCSPFSPVPCPQPDVMCGQLQCMSMYGHPYESNYGQNYKSIRPWGCSAAQMSQTSDDVGVGMVADGTKCGEKKMCIKQKCVAI